MGLHGITGFHAGRGVTGGRARIAQAIVNKFLKGKPKDVASQFIRGAFSTGATREFVIYSLRERRFLEDTTNMP